MQVKMKTDRTASALWSAFSPKKASLSDFRAAYGQLREIAVIDNDIYEEWYELMKKAGKPEDHEGWKQVVMYCFEQIDAFSERRPIEEELDGLAHRMRQLVRLNMKLEDTGVENRLFVFKVLTDIVTSYTTDDQKLIYPAVLYWVATDMAQNAMVKSFYGDDMKNAIVEETILAVFEIQSFGSYDYSMPTEVICDVMASTGAEQYVTVFCKEMLDVSDSYLRNVIRSPKTYMLKNPTISKGEVDAFVRKISTKVDIKNIWTIIFGVLALLICIVVFCLGRVTATDGGSQTVIADLQAQIQEKDNKIAELKAENTELSDKIKALTNDGKDIFNQPVEDDKNQTAEKETEAQVTANEDSVIGAGPAAGTEWAVPQIINFREEKTASYNNIIDVIEEGEYCKVLEEKDADGWIKVYFEGDTGYINFDN